MTHTRGTRPPPEQTVERESQAWYYRTQKGWTQYRIAEHLAVSQTAVSKMLRRVSDRVIRELDDEVQQEILVQLNLHRLIVSECLDSWEKSKIGRKSMGRSSAKRTATMGDEKADLGELVTTRQDLVEHFGDIQFLRTALEAMANIRHLLNMETTNIIVTDWRQYVPEGYSSDTVVQFFADLAVGEMVVDGASG